MSRDEQSTLQPSNHRGTIRHQIMEPSPIHRDVGLGAKVIPRFGAAGWFFLSVLILLGVAEERRFAGSRLPAYGAWSWCAIAVSLLLLAYGWWFRRSWARRASLVLLWSIAGACFALIVSQPIVNSDLLMPLLFLAIPGLPVSALLLWYLHCHASKAIFCNTDKPSARFTVLGLMGIVMVAAISLALFKHFLRDDAYYLVTAVQHAERGDHPSAMRQIQAIRSKYYERRAWQEVAWALARAGDARCAIEATDQLSPDLQQVTLRDIAVTFADAGRANEFMQTLGSVKGPEVKAQVRDRVASYLSEMASGPLPPGLSRPINFEEHFGDEDVRGKPERQ